jgi:hypothetical protein
MSKLSHPHLHDEAAALQGHEQGRLVGQPRPLDHSEKEYVCYELGRVAIHTTTVEDYFSVFKRGMRGIYQHCKEKHLHRYLAEFDFRYNARSALGVEHLERAEKALRGVADKRLTYRKARPGSAQQGAQP